MMQDNNMNFFDISSVVVIGASSIPGKVGNDLIKNLKQFDGKTVGVNLSESIIDGVVVYDSISKIPFVPDIAVIAIPAQSVLQSLEECGLHGIKRVIIISSGFKEIGNTDGENNIKNIAKKYNIKILGPNCLGYIDAYKNLNLSFGSKIIKQGNIAIISQSGAIAVALTDRANSMNLGFSKIVSMGNKSDINENDLLCDLINDVHTDVIMIYLESIYDGSKFYEITKQITKKKPIILIKSGMSERGKTAANSHTGALSGENKIFEVACRDAGIHVVYGLEDFFGLGYAFSKSIGKTIPDKFIIVTNAGGPGVMVTDDCQSYNIELQNFSETEKNILKSNLPDSASINNPIDIIGDATSIRYKDILSNIVDLNQNYGIVLLLTPQKSTDVDNVAYAICDFQNNNPQCFIVVSFMGAISVDEARKYFRIHNILEYDYPKKGIFSISHLQNQKKWQSANIDEYVQIETIDAMQIDHIRQQLKEQTTLCNNQLIAVIFKAFQVPFLEEQIVNNIADVDKVFDGKNIQYVAKIVSKDIAHKTDCGGVVLGLKTKKEAIDAYHSIIKNVSSVYPKAQIDGVMFQAMLPLSKEIFVGFKRDIDFGDVMIIGIGGVLVNLYEDVYIKLSPIGKKEIKYMFTQLKGFQILSGYRGEGSIDFDKLIDIIFKIMSIFTIFKEIKEIDINPIFSNYQNSIVVDAKFYI